MRKDLLSNTTLYNFIVILLSTVPCFSFSQVKFSAVSSDNKIGRNDYLNIKYVVENADNVEQIIPPPFKNFVVISGPNQESSSSSINGIETKSIALEFILKPNATGTFILPAATAKVNGKTLRSNSLSIVVTNNSSGASAGGGSPSPFGNIITEAFAAPSLHRYDDYILGKDENINEKIKKNLFVRLEVNKTSCYVGEPILATYKLYTRLKSESNLTKTPSFNGFSVSEMKMPDNYTTGVEKYKGREYSVYTLRKVQLYPLQPGNITLDPIEVENNLTFIKADYAKTKNGDFFYNMMRDFNDAVQPGEGMIEQKITLQSKPLNILVKPLPAINQPKDFKGIAGAFAIQATAEKKNLTTDEAGNLTITISGNGNIQMINPPAISWPEGIEAFEPKSLENIDNTAVPLRGQKTFKYPFTVSTAGTYTIPPLTFSYFNLATKGYKILSTAPLVINVKKGGENKPALSGQLPLPANSKAEVVNKTHLLWPWFLIFAAFGITALIVGFRKTKAKKEPIPTPLIGDKNEAQLKSEPAQTQEAALLQNPLQEAELILLQEDARNFYYSLNNCLIKYLSLKLNYPEEELSRKKISELLDKKNVSVGTTLRLASLLEDIDLHLYAPPSPANHMQHMYENATELTGLLDKQLISFP